MLCCAYTVRFMHSLYKVGGCVTRAQTTIALILIIIYLLAYQWYILTIHLAVNGKKCTGWKGSWINQQETWTPSTVKVPMSDTQFLAAVCQMECAMFSYSCIHFVPQTEKLWSRIKIWQTWRLPRTKVKDQYLNHSVVHLSHSSLQSSAYCRSPWHLE